MLTHPGGRGNAAHALHEVECHALALQDGMGRPCTWWGNARGGGRGWVSIFTSPFFTSPFFTSPFFTSPFFNSPFFTVSPSSHLVSYLPASNMQSAARIAI
ncbi:unnamed protein product [Closterium sp. NIES-54]